jgi:putative addiction module CopG family antidote
MQIRLNPEAAKFVRRMIATGRFKNAADVVRGGLRLLDDEEERWRADTRRKIEEGMKQLRAGQVVDGKMAVAKIRGDLRRRHSQSKGGTDSRRRKGRRGRHI